MECFLGFEGNVGEGGRSIRHGGFIRGGHLIQTLHGGLIRYKAFT